MSIILVPALPFSSSLLLFFSSARKAARRSSPACMTGRGLSGDPAVMIDDGTPYANTAYRISQEICYQFRLLTVKTLRMQSFGVWISSKLKQIFIETLFPETPSLESGEARTRTPDIFHAETPCGGSVFGWTAQNPTRTTQGTCVMLTSTMISVCISS